MRIGQGFDVHEFIKNRKLILGGVEIPFEKGLKGHSDADVLTHAVCDALLGGAGLGDIGLHFPDTDEFFKDISSMVLLQKTYGMLKDKGYFILNIDATVLAQKPKIYPFREEMCKNIASVLNLQKDQVNIKATTTEGLGFIGRVEGIAAMCVAILNNIP